MMLESVREEVCDANRQLVTKGLVASTWGNVSGFDPGSGLVVIKPSGVPYAELTPACLVIVDLEGVTVEGALRPSSDTPTHVQLYKSFSGIEGVTHTHSQYATMFAQACRPLPCLGTTHADLFHGDVPVTRLLTEEEVGEGYELNTGKLILETFKDIDPLEMPAVLVAMHAPFAWGKSPMDSVENSAGLEQVAKMAVGTLKLRADQEPLPPHILQKHHDRKHGSDAYYGQDGRKG